VKIAIVAPSAVPYVVGGAEKFWWGLLRAFNTFTNHEVELIKIPSPELAFWDLLESYRRFSQVDLSHFDAVISTKYPAWMVHHHNHHCYMQHKLRGLYELYSSGDEREIYELPPAFDGVVRLITEMPRMRETLPLFWDEIFSLRDREDLSHAFAFPGPLIRAIVHFLDDIALSPEYIRSYSAISRRVSEREGYFPEGVSVRVIHHPSNLEGLHCSDYRFVFTASRLTDLKRVDMIVRAFRRLKADVKLKIAGTGSELERLKELAEGDGRIEFLGFVNDMELVGLYASALFVPFVPYDEDYGLITVEAMQSSKPVITVSDAGGVTELVENGINGYCVEPGPEYLAEAMEKLMNDHEQAVTMGKRAFDTVAHIRWDNVVKILLEQISSCGSISESGPVIIKKASRKKVLVLSTFGINPPIGGGQRRIYYLYKELARDADVTVLALVNADETMQEQEICPGFHEIRVPRSPGLAELDKRLERELGIPAEDVSAIDGIELIPDFCEIAQQYAENSDIVVFSHPYLFYALPDLNDKIVWYDAHNVEYDMKKAVMPQTETGRWVLDRVYSVERDCCLSADLIFACSDRDKRRLEKLYGLEERKILIVPNGLNVEHVTVLSREERQELRRRLRLHSYKRVVLFIGSWHGPNIEAVQQVLKIAENIPDYAFLVVGSVCYHDVCSDYVPDNVFLLGVLDEKEKKVVLNTSHIAINPILSGSGTNLKLLEYLAYHLPVITTEHGNRGYEFHDGVHLLIREIDEFEKTLKTLADDRELKRCIGMAKEGSKLVIRRYTWPVCARAIRSAISRSKFHTQT